MPDLLYVDTSALLDRALGQKRHHEIATAMRDHGRAGGRLVASRLLHLEARRAFVRESLRGYDVSPITELAALITALPVTEDVWAEAHRIEQHARTLDALHVATCKLVAATLLSTDTNMVAVASAIGIAIHPASTPTDD